MMPDSDDEFSDGIVLDDQMLALLDEEETRFQRATNPNAGDPGPPAKRRKLDTGHALNLGVSNHSIPDDTDDLPDITVRRDGTYGIELHGSISLAPNAALGGNTRSSTASVSRPALISSNNSLGFRNSTTHAPLPRATQSRRPSSTTHPARVLSTRMEAQPISPSQSESRPHTVDPSLTALFDAELADMRRLVNELRKNNKKIQDELTVITADKLTKDGEVSWLRKSIEKTAQDHAAQIAKLRAAKDESEAKQVQMQKQMREEAERLKTQFTFRQHEIETSTRKSPQKKIHMAPSATPTPLPSQMQRWNHNEAVAGPSRVVQETSTRPRFGEIARNERARKSMAENQNLPSGFQTSASPTRSQVTDYMKGKGKVLDKGKRGPFNVQFDSGPPPASLPAGGSQTAQDDVYGDIAQDDTFMNESVDTNLHPQDDVEMADGTQDPQPLAPVDEEIEEVEPHRWLVDLHRIILMHIEPTGKMTTLHALLGVSLPPGPKSDAYTSACSRILDVLARIPTRDHQDWEDAAQTICRALTEMAVELVASNHTTSLAALFSQLTDLTYTLPTPHRYLLVDNATGVEEDGDPRILTVISSVIQDHVSKLDNHETEKSDLGILAKESLALLQALCWNTPSDLENRLALVPGSPSVLSTLVDLSRPTWFLFYSTRILFWLSTRPVLFRSLLLFPDTEGQRRDYTKLLHIERMCLLLIRADDGVDTGQADEIKRHILRFFALLSMAHSSAHVILVESPSVIPSITSYLHGLTALVWQGDEALESDPETASRVIQRMNQTSFLLHHLIIRAEADLRLRDLLEHAPGEYNGVVHLFIVAMSRLSFADVPEWVQGKDKQELEKVAELARELLELVVVEGPELDAIWATYQEEPDEGDDEEAEARRLDANEM